jgi:hypothetical protein
MIENLNVISFGIGLALLGLWIVTGPGRELAYLRQQGFVAVPQQIPTVSNVDPANK